MRARVGTLLGIRVDDIVLDGQVVRGELVLREVISCEQGSNAGVLGLGDQRTGPVSPVRWSIGPANSLLD